MAEAKPIAAASRRPLQGPEHAGSIALRAPHDAAEPCADEDEPAGVAGPRSPRVNLTAAVIAVQNDTPVVLTTVADGLDRLPSALFQLPSAQTLETCLRDGVAGQIGISIGHVEQLLAFADRPASLGIGYLALTRAVAAPPAGTHWRNWFEFLPWEDWRRGRPPILANVIEPRLRAWADAEDDGETVPQHLSRQARIHMAFGIDRVPWNEERVAERFELLVESRLIDSLDIANLAMPRDHMRVLANAIGALRTKLKTRPIVFELMAAEFTLFELQKTVEAILGPHLHKQNFRRLIESAGLVEATGEVRVKTGGRPAKLFRFRRDVLMERPAPGVRVHAPRT